MAYPRIDPRYEIRETIGKGGMGIVYKAYDDQRRGYVAIKTIRDGADPIAIQMFLQEWRTLANISHPNIIEMFHAGEYEEDRQRKPYFVMPFLTGQTLDALIHKSTQRLSVETVVELLRQACRGLFAAHSAGLIHRDLKPSNLFVINGTDLKIIDFGMVHLADSQNSVSGIKGTLQYMSPEQVEGKELTPATDIFSVGVVAYEALTGRKPFDRGSEKATKHAIVNDFTPSLSDLNPAVNSQLARVIAKAMAKNPWSRFSSTREFEEYLQKALIGDETDLFDPSKTRPRFDRARQAIQEGDYEYAQEILDELQSEGHLDSEIGVLSEEIKQGAKNKALQKLLDQARTRLKEGAFAQAWQRVQEALHRDPGNAEAQQLQAEIETRQNEQKIEQWRVLVSQHLHNHAFFQARQAVEAIRKIKPDAVELLTLSAEVDRLERQFRRSCEEKNREYESAMRSYVAGDVTAALSKFERILDPERPDAGFVEPEQDQLHREAYNKIRSEWEEAQRVRAEIRANIDAANFSQAADMVAKALERTPNDLELRAFRLTIEDLIRRQTSSYIADVGRHVENEPDLDKTVQILEEALQKYPTETHFQELAASMRRRRDLVNSIAARARQCEEQNLLSEASTQWNTLRGIHPRYPGLDIELERIQRRIEQLKREDAKLKWVDQIEELRQRGEYAKALERLEEALLEFPEDPELISLGGLVNQDQERSAQGEALSKQAQEKLASGNILEAIELLRRALSLQPANERVRADLANALAAQARILHATDWRSAESFVEEALAIDPNLAPAKSLRPSIQLSKRQEFVDKCIREARELQTGGDPERALARVQEALGTYPNDARLTQLASNLRRAIGEQHNLRRSTDLEGMYRLVKEADHVRVPHEFSSIVGRSAELSGRYPDDPEFSVIHSEIQKRGNESLSRVIDAYRTTTKGPPTPIRPVIKENKKDTDTKETPIVRLRRIWNQLGVPMLERVRSSFGRARGFIQVHYQFGGSQKRAIAAWAAAILVLAIVGVVVISRRAGHKPPIPESPKFVRTIFVGDLEGAALRLGKEILNGTATELKPGKYELDISKLGYRPSKKEFEVREHPETVPIELEPEPQVLRIVTNVLTAKVLLDGKEIGTLQDGNFTHSLPGSGSHKLEVFQNRTRIFEVQFQQEPANPARLTSPAASGGVPLIAVSTLGAHGFVYTSSSNAKANFRNEDPVAIPPDGHEISFTPENNELAYSDSDAMTPMFLPIEVTNAPTLLIRVGTAPKGTLLITTNLTAGSVIINGQKSPRGVQKGKWTSQLDPGVYRVGVVEHGYEDPPEQSVTLVAGKSTRAAFDLKPLVESAFLRIEGGTPNADVLVDGSEVGTLDANGSLAPITISPDVDHVVRVQKAEFEATELHRRPAAKATTILSGTQARLKPFGKLDFSIDPPDARVMVTREGEPSDALSGKLISLKEGTYIINATAEGYEALKTPMKVEVISGKTVRVMVKLTKLVTRVEKKDPETNELFDNPATWKKRDDGFWVHEGPAWFNDAAFDYQLEFARIKKTFNRQEKIGFRIYFQGSDYIECEIDGTNYSRREVVAGKEIAWVRYPHKLPSRSTFLVKLKTSAQGFSIVVGEATDTLLRPIEGRTALDGKVALRLKH